MAISLAAHCWTTCYGQISATDRVERSSHPCRTGRWLFSAHNDPRRRSISARTHTLRQDTWGCGLRIIVAPEVVIILTAQLSTLKLTLCRVAQSANFSFMVRASPSDPFLVLATFNGEFIRPEGSSIYIPEKGLIYIQMRERFRCADGAFNRAPDCCSLRTGSLNPELSRIGLAYVLGLAYEIILYY